MPDTAQLSEAIHTLTGILQHQKDRGNDGILLPEAQIEILTRLPQQFRQRYAACPAVAQNLENVMGHATAHTTVASANAPASAGNAAPPARPGPQTPKTVLPDAQNQDKRNRLNALARSVKADTDCQALGTLRDTMVFASGNPDARLMLIGEAPGAEEELKKKPFTGPAGQLLDRILAGMGFDRQDVYISNIVKFRPQVAGAQNSTSENREPSRDEINACLKYTMAEIDVVQPELIIALGATAANALLETDTPVGKLREQNHSVKGIPLIVTYHPSYLLKCESSSPAKLKEEKRKVWNDMKSAMEKLGIPARG